MHYKQELTAVGSAALDTIETPHGKVEDVLGGSVFYIGAAAGLFAPTNIVAVVGDDFPFDEIEFLRERNVNFDGLETAMGDTFRWSGRYHKNMNIRDTLSTELGVFAGFEPKLPFGAAEAKYLLLANIHPELQLDVLEQMEEPRLVAFDTMNLWIETAREQVLELIKKVDLVIINDEEITLLTGEISPFAGASKIIKMGPRYVVVKKGEHGSVLISRDDPPFLCPAFPLAEAKDPTGAGDTFAGAMMGYLAATDDLGDFNMRRSIIYGTITASFTVEDFSIERLKQITSDDIEERVRVFRTMVEF
ncbi:bifunctional hydroxymethylpyrimidine kinase/phosphomethylpyrimidine kinase [bacterium]|nr:bifunctional hydroxymethylpyrimidine kinase/phosphomethylpyrimidine kinase [bacterium]